MLFRSDTLTSFSARLARGRPDLAAALEEVIGPYQLWRYGSGPRTPRQATRLAARLRQSRRALEKRLSGPPQEPGVGSAERMSQADTAAGEAGLTTGRFQ